MKSWVYIKILLLIGVLVAVVWMARDLKTNGIDPALLGFDSAESTMPVQTVCSAPPVALEISAEGRPILTKLAGTTWVSEGLGPKDMQQIELGIVGLCSQDASKTVNFDGLKRAPTFKESIKLTMLDRKTLTLRMTEAGLVEVNGKYYLNADFINAIELLTAGAPE